MLSVVIGDELIETLWNVNFFSLNTKYPFENELIETLWNVNRRMGKKDGK